MSNKKQYTIDITEAKAVKLFDEKYGKNPISRFGKALEEFIELKEAYEHYENLPKGKEKEEALLHVYDELSDAKVTILHFGHCLPTPHYTEELLDMAIDKVKGREKDPGYKRYPKLVNNVCPDCNNRTLIMFTADLEMCTNCKRTFDGK